MQCRINKSSRLTALYGLQEGAMQEHILHINLMNGPAARDGQEEHCADHGQLEHQAEGLIIVDVELLGEAVKAPTSLVAFQKSIGVELVLEDQFVGDDIGANGMRDKIVGVVGDQRSKFFFQGMEPIQIDKGSVDIGGHRRQGRRESGRQGESVDR
jgi:hypothetical protein